MPVLLHDSHHSKSRPDGWSGAPGEAVWVQQLNDRIANRLQARGIEVVRVPGDLLDHPEFHRDYACFIAPHYESDTHDTHLDHDTGQPTRGGWFWGRAVASTTAEADDRLGAIFERRYRELLARFPDGPDEHEEWTTVNVTDYYGFRLTTDKTPGMLVENGVGDPADPSDDGAWMRMHLDDIADVYAGAIAEFTQTQEDDMFTDEDRANLKRVRELLEAREPLVWIARVQRKLDVELGDEFDPARPPKDPRIKT